MEILGLHAKISGDTSELKESLEAGKEALNEFGINVDKIKQFLTGGAGLALAFIEVGKEGIEAASKFAEATQQMGRATGVLGPQLNEMKNQLHEVMASGVEQSVGDIGQAMSQLTIRFHVSGEELTTLTKTFAEFADINNVAVGPAVESTSKVIAKFGLDVSETEPLLDKLTYTSQQTGLSVDSLSQSLVDNGAIFKGANLSINDSISLLAGFEQGGVDSGRAIQGLRTAITGFQKDGEDAGKGLKELIEQIKNTKDANEAAQIAVAHFGRGAQDMLQAIRGGFVDIEGFNSKLEQSEGTLKRTGDGTKTVEEKMKQLQNQVQNLGAEAFQGLLEAGKPIIDFLSILLQLFEKLPGPVKETIEVTGLFLAALKITQVVLAVFGRELTVAFGPIGIITAAIIGLTGGLNALIHAQENYIESLKKEIDLNNQKLKSLKDNFDAAQNLVGPVNEGTKAQKLNEEQVTKLLSIYPELNRYIKAGVTSYEELQIAIKSVNAAREEEVQKVIKSQIAAIQEKIAWDTREMNTMSGRKAAHDKYQKDIDDETVALRTLESQLKKSEEGAKGIVSPPSKPIIETTTALSNLQKQLAIVDQKLTLGAINFEEAYKERLSLIQAAIDAVAKDGEVTGKVDAAKLAGLVAQKKAIEGVNADIVLSADYAGKSLTEIQGDYEKFQKGMRDDTIKSLGEMTSGFKTFGGFIGSLASAIADDFKDAFKDIGKIVQSTLATIGTLVKQSFDTQIEMLNRQMSAEEQAAGVSEQTAVQKAQVNLQAAQSQYDGETDATKKAADAQAIIEAQKALKKAKIEEDFQHRIAQMQYEQAHAAWVLNMLQIAVAGGLAVMQAYAQLGPIGGSIAGGIITGITVAEELVAANNEPKPPAFARGTDFTPGGMALVGELGPEMVNLPRGSQVINNTKTEQMLSNQSNSATHIHIHNPKESSISDMARSLTIQQRKLSHEMRALR